MVSSTGATFGAVWFITLAGGLVLLGALATLTKDTDGPIPGAYKLAWTAWSLEVFALLVGLFALAVGPYRNWKSTVLALYATVTAILIPLTNDVLGAKSGLPGSNGSDTRSLVAAAGLIIVIVGNFVQMLLSSVHDVEEPAVQAQGFDAKDMA